MTIFSPEDVDAGLKRLGMSSDARFLRQRLMEVLVGVSAPGLSDGAVRHQEGRRSFAAELIASLGLNGGTTGGRTDSDAADHVRTGTGQPVRSGTGGPARRVPARDPDAGER